MFRFFPLHTKTNDILHTFNTAYGYCIPFEIKSRRMEDYFIKCKFHNEFCTNNYRGLFILDEVYIYHKKMEYKIKSYKHYFLRGTNHV